MRYVLAVFVVLALLAMLGVVVEGIQLRRWQASPKARWINR